MLGSSTSAASCPPQSSAPRQQQGAAGFNVASADNLLIFWPDKLIPLDHLVSFKPSTKPEQDTRSHALLIGIVVYGHSQEAAVVVIGTVQGHSPDAVFNKIASKGLTVVGSILADHDATCSLGQSGFDRSTLSSCHVWLTMLSPSSSDELPSIVSVHFSESGAAKDNVDATTPYIPCAFHLVGYSVPNSRMLQYFALEPLRLAPVSGMKLVSTASALLVPDAQLPVFSKMMAANSASSELQNKFLQLLLLDPVHWRSQRRIQPQLSLMPRGTALRRSIELINRLQAQHGRFTIGSAVSTANSATNGCVANEVNAGETARRVSLLASTSNALTRVALGVQRALRYPLYTPREPPVGIDGVARLSTGPRPSPLRLTSISACAKQLDVRISQLIVAPRLASRLRYLRKQQKLPIDEIAAPYIGLWNAIWLIANDIILGHAASVFLLQTRAQLAEFGRILAERYLFDSVLWLLSWLENWPAGLKLNTELSLFFSDAYSSLTSAWHSQGLVHILPRLEFVIVGMALAGRFMGVTMVLCMLQDLLSICTLHITIFYTLSFRTLRAFVYVLSALFDVFRGKKRNALRGGRLDDASYELDQLLLGTLLFTLVAFLFPTVYVYYLAFGLIRLAVVGFEVGVVETCLGLLNHLPLFALMLRFKDPHRLPAGVWLQEVGQAKPATHARVLRAGRFRLRSRPLAIGDIFEGYGQHVGGVVELPSMVLRWFLGRPLRRSVPSPS
ncbi:related to GPI1 - required for N-acetylglucosaminyl phosphatidylinositol synthesis [Ustilago trichophora]|uniref:Related to GPI1 - required for N-acetylglucosaminyl phosphatidylinositol synthesis n=1 Tax=Ustilago trichophora TaxID=86804 RepID=A0A5C3DR60_9BASI|nr:related to GPI1 - required for N-acetylglucosaminyl phosphatidylinositol synthesis [Ustilago trichophora]